jgi:hypothetical protein
MTRHIHRTRITALAGLASVAALALTATPASAHLECPPGTTNPAYCTNLQPVAVTQPASAVGTTTATLHGQVDGFGDNTRYFFEYGLAGPFGFATPSGVVPGCPPGVANPNSCVGIGFTEVSAALGGLAPDTTYHFRLVATNSSGTAFGAEETFTTARRVVEPIEFVHAPARVHRHRHFAVTVRLRTRAHVVIELLHRNHVLDRFNKGEVSHSVRQEIRAPGRGTYTIRVIARTSEVTQTDNRTLHVT